MTFWSCKKWLDYEDKVNFEVYDVTICHHVLALHILPNISRSKGNQTMKFGQLIEYSTRNNFVEKSYTKYPGLNIPRPLQKKIKIEDISGSIHVNSVML